MGEPFLRAVANAKWRTSWRTPATLVPSPLTESLIVLLGNNDADENQFSACSNGQQDGVREWNGNSNPEKLDGKVGIACSRPRMGNVANSYKILRLGSG